jgi:DnaJ-class molecular chaperone
MYDFSQPNDKPGVCGKCRGSGVYGWGACINGKMQFSGPCHSCGGKGTQTKADIKRDHGYNYYKLRRLSSV